MAKTYKVLTGISFQKDNLGQGFNWEPGEIVTTFPKGANVDWWLKIGAIEEVEAAKPPLKPVPAAGETNDDEDSR